MLNSSYSLMAAITLSAILSTACTDSPTEAKATITPEGVRLSVSDPGLNYNDTWVSTTAIQAETTVVNTDQPFTDPATGQQTTTLTVAEEPKTVEILAGYGYDGQLRVTTNIPSSYGYETETVQQIGDGTGDVNHFGGANSDPLPIEPTVILGSLQNAQLDPTGNGQLCGHGEGQPPCENQTDRMTDAVRGVNATLLSSDENRATIVQPLVFDTKSSASGKRSTGRIVRELQKQNDKWLLKHVMSEEENVDQGRSNRTRVHFTFSAIKFHQNDEFDKERAKRRESQNTARSGRASRGIIPEVIRNGVASLPRFMQACDPDVCGGYMGGSNEATQPSDLPAPDEGIVGSGEFTHLVSTSGPLVVLQHGFFSSSQTFPLMDRWLRTDIGARGYYLPSLDWTQTYETQAGQLQSRVSAISASAGGVIFVGHSNGGMVSRYLARHPSGTSVSGVVTIGTPHQGTPLARYGRDIDNLLGFGGGLAAVLCHYTNGAGCTQVSDMRSSSMQNFYGAIAGYTPVLGEMQPRDSYHTQFNAESEGFNRYGIQSYSWKRWQAWRVWGDSKCYPESSCGGRAKVKKADRAYHHDISCAIVGMFIQFWAASGECALDAAFMVGFDGVYRRFADRDAESDELYGDGVVPGWSQRYPNIPEENQYPVHDGSSHLGETKDPRVACRVESILTDRLSVPRIGNTFATCN